MPAQLLESKRQLRQQMSRLRLAVLSAEADRAALGQAALLVILASVARGVGAFEAEGLIGLVGSPLVGLGVWLAGSTLIWGIGVKRFGYTSDYPELLRTVGFAAALPSSATTP